MPFKDGKHPGGRPQEADSVRGRRLLESEAREMLREEAAERLIAASRLTLTPELVDLIVSGIAAGNYPQVVARSLGVNEYTYAGWVSRGEQRWVEQKDLAEPDFTSPADPLGLEVELYLRVDQADADWESGLVQDMNKRIRDGSYWAGHMTFLQRRHPERWNDRGRDTGSSAGIEGLAEEWRRMMQERRHAGELPAARLADVEIDPADVHVDG
jgi:hypothetical protein